MTGMRRLSTFLRYFCAKPCLLSVYGAEAELDSNVPFFEARLRPGRPIQSLDPASELDCTAQSFKWAPARNGFQHSSDTLERMIFKLGLEGKQQEMELLLKDMAKLESPEFEATLDRLVHWFCAEGRVEEAAQMLQFSTSAKHRLSLSACNALLRSVDSLSMFLKVYKDMLKSGVLPDVETLNCLIKALCDIGRLDLALDQYNRMHRKQCSPNSWTFEMLIAALCSNGRVEESVDLFRQMINSGCVPDVGFYFRILPLFCQINKFEEAHFLYRKMKEAGIRPDSNVHGSVVWLLCENHLVDEAAAIFEEFDGLSSVPRTSMILHIVNEYCISSRFHEAESFLRKINCKEIEPYDQLLEAFCQVGQFVDSIAFLQRMGDLSTTGSWNVIIRGFCERGYIRKAFQVVARMITSSFAPDEETYSAIMNGYCRISSPDSALDIFRLASANNWRVQSESLSDLVKGLCELNRIKEAADLFYYHAKCGRCLSTESVVALVQGICLSGNIREAVKVRSLSARNSSICSPLCYTSILNSLLDLKKDKCILALLGQMIVEGYVLDGQERRDVLHGLCTKSTTMREAAILFNEMIELGGSVPDPGTLEVVIVSIATSSSLKRILHSLRKIVEDQDDLLSPRMCNVIVRGLIKEGFKNEARIFLDKMLEKGSVPEPDTHGLVVSDVFERLGNGNSSLHLSDDEDPVISILSEGLN